MSSFFVRLHEMSYLCRNYEKEQNHTVIWNKVSRYSSGNGMVQRMEACIGSK